MDEQDLNSAVRESRQHRPAVWACMPRNLQTGVVVEVDADRVQPTESAAKTFMLLTFCRRVAAGLCDPEAEVTVPENFRVDGTGVLRYLSDGVTLTLEDLVWLMVIVSDNVATALVLLALGGPDVVNESMAAIGLATARLNSYDDMAAGGGFGVSCPRDLAEAYTHLDERGREKLFRQQDLIGLPRALHHHAHATDLGVTVPLRVFNKTGTGYGTFIDAGLFETDTASWVAAVMVTEQTDFTSCPDDEAPVLAGRIGSELFRAWSQT